jgi:hypothetical protein
MDKEQVIKEIKSKGYWEVNIHPTNYQKELIPPNKIKYCIENSIVSLRGWAYPHIYGKEDENEKGPYTGQTEDGILYIEKYVKWWDVIEFWRFTTSGNFYHLFGMGEDWNDKYKRDYPFLSFLSTLYSICEIFEFSKRLFIEKLEIETVSINVNWYGLENRKIISLDRFIPPRFTCSMPHHKYSTILNKENFINIQDEIAKCFENLMFIFNWVDFKQEIIKDDIFKFLQHKI